MKKIEVVSSALISIAYMEWDLEGCSKNQEFGNFNCDDIDVLVINHVILYKSVAYQRIGWRPYKSVAHQRSSPTQTRLRASPPPHL